MLYMDNKDFFSISKSCNITGYAQNRDSSELSNNIETLRINSEFFSLYSLQASTRPTALWFSDVSWTRRIYQLQIPSNPPMTYLSAR